MKITTAPWAAFLLASFGRALAGVVFTNDDYYIYAGQPFTITWTDARGPVTITLMEGPDIDLQEVLVIVSGYQGQEYTWTPPPTLAAGSYELQISDGGSTDYSPRFTYPAPPTSPASSSGLNPTDTGPSSTPPPATLPTAPPTSSSTPPPPASTAPTSEPPSSSSTLPLAAKVAIAVLGSLLAVVLLLLLVYILTARHRRRRRRRLAAAAAASAGAAEGGGDGGAPMSLLSGNTATTELSAVGGKADGER
ncbi:0c1de677-73f3-475b-bfc8-399f4e7f2b7f [Thermothielavioides terrestris]|uniref:0c1de677-73f3-475b-bfc8-399f4e7f2b7f n=1 Tax=Thermothielavioides terrestris TaxID=2587410 RepID=A0A446BX36_9PEZI|nr:0c1de677-73f3-475b-bfc8-399f4e7f2b7f [Thermothielavioides terrestris]